jgi:hypothetical protein
MTGFNWIRIGSNTGFCDNSDETLGFTKAANFLTSKLRTLHLESIFFVCVFKRTNLYKPPLTSLSAMLWGPELDSHLAIKFGKQCALLLCPISEDVKDCAK